MKYGELVLSIIAAIGVIGPPLVALYAILGGR